MKKIVCDYEPVGNPLFIGPILPYEPYISSLTEFPDWEGPKIRDDEEEILKQILKQIGPVFSRYFRLKHYYPLSEPIGLNKLELLDWGIKLPLRERLRAFWFGKWTCLIHKEKMAWARVNFIDHSHPESDLLVFICLYKNCPQGKVVL